MEITEKITLDMLTQDSVSVKREKYININGVEMKVGEIVRNTYENSEYGRTLIEKELPPEYLTAVMAVWGNTATVVNI